LLTSPNWITLKLRTHGVEFAVVTIRTPDDIVPAMNDIKTSGAAAINVLSSPLLYGSRRLVIERAAALRLPAIYEWAEMAEEGGLIAPAYRISVGEWAPRTAKPNARTETTLRTVAGRAFMVSA
jgi:ABC-type uncharacterized transport system substrate-binding protein